MLVDSLHSFFCCTSTAANLFLLKKEKKEIHSLNYLPIPRAKTDKISNQMANTVDHLAAHELDIPNKEAVKTRRCRGENIKRYAHNKSQRRFFLLPEKQNFVFDVSKWTSIDQQMRFTWERINCTCIPPSPSAAKTSTFTSLKSLY